MAATLLTTVPEVKPFLECFIMVTTVDKVDGSAVILLYFYTLYCMILSDHNFMLSI